MSFLTSCEIIVKIFIFFERGILFIIFNPLGKTHQKLLQSIFNF